MTKQEKIIEALENMHEWDIMSAHNESNPYSNIYHMDELDDILSGTSPSEVARLIFFGDFNPNHDYFTFNGYGNLESVYSIWDKIYIDEIAEYRIDNDEDFDDSDIRRILDEGDEDDEDDGAA